MVEYKTGYLPPRIGRERAGGCVHRSPARFPQGCLGSLTRRNRNPCPRAARGRVVERSNPIPESSNVSRAAVEMSRVTVVDPATDRAVTLLFVRGRRVVSTGLTITVAVELAARRVDQAGRFYGEPLRLAEHQAVL